MRFFQKKIHFSTFRWPKSRKTRNKIGNWRPKSPIAHSKIRKVLFIPYAAVLYAHVAHHLVEVIHRHVEGLCHLRCRQRVLGIFVQHAKTLADNIVSQGKNLLRRRQTSYAPLSNWRGVGGEVSPFQLLPSQYQLCTCLIVELCGDIKALRFGERIARAKLSVSVFVRPELKFQPGYFLPGRFHISDSLHHVLVLLTCQLCNFERRHCLFVLFFLNNINNWSEPQRWE